MAVKQEMIDHPTNVHNPFSAGQVQMGAPKTTVWSRKMIKPGSWITYHPTTLSISSQMWFST